MLDIILFLIIFSYLFEGWKKGLALTGLSIIGYVFSIFISNRLSHILTENILKDTNILNVLHKNTHIFVRKVNNKYIFKLFKDLEGFVFSNTFLDALVFLILFVTVSKIIDQVIKRLNKLIPFDFLDIVDRVLGSILGMLRGFLMIFILLALVFELIEVDKNITLKRTVDKTIFVKGLYKNNPIIRIANKMK